MVNSGGTAMPSGVSQVASSTPRPVVSLNALAQSSAEAFDAGTTVACICGTDKDYASDAAALAAELKGAGATQVWLAGKPDLAVDGIDGYVFAGCDALAVLRSVHEQLGVQA